MDHEALRGAYDELNERQCPFEKVVLFNQAGCRLARRLCIGEREAVGCADEHAQQRCLAFLDQVRHRARFALKTASRDKALTHAKAMRIQIGGLRGVRAAFSPDAPATSHIEDIDELLRRAAIELGSLAALPWSVVIQQVAAYRGRRPPRRRT